MARIQYREINFNRERSERIVWIDKLLQEYQGKRITVRQAFYRLVAAGKILNQPNEYDKIQNLITDARYAGLIDWNAIEDRNREPLKSEDWASGHAGLDQLVEKFRLNRWETQPFYVELWVEKAALAGVLWPIAQDYHATLMVTRGFNSASAMKEAADRISYYSRAGKRPVVLYIGDFDPSGLDMLRDVRVRLAEFGCPSELDVRQVAITREQIDEYKPPPNPLKRRDDSAKYKNADGELSDSRAARYMEEHGEESWEADALPPDVLDLTTRTMLNAYVDKKAMQAVIARENLIKNQIKKFSLGFKEP